MTYNDFMSAPQMMSALRISSVSDDDARIRGNEYAKIFSRNDELMEAAQGMPIQKTFSGYSETPLLSTQYFNASVASYVSSFAGYMSIERDFDQPNGLFYWFDVLGVTDLRPVIPNLGPDSYQDINAMGQFTLEITPAATADYSSLIGRKLIPGSLRVKIKTATESYELMDNGQGTFMAVAGKITASAINYLNGKVTFTLATALKGDATTESITVVGKEDVTGTPSCTTGASNAHANDKRFIAKM